MLHIQPPGPIDHEAIGKVMFTKGFDGAGCIGVKDNPYHKYQSEWIRRKNTAGLRALITEKIEMLYEPRFITHPETCELIEALITMTDSKKLLEIGVYSGMGSLHMLRAIIGKPGATLTCVEARPAHDKEFFSNPEIQEYFKFVEGWTPDILTTLKPNKYDFVFIDSDHSVEHSQKERAALEQITDPGCFWLFHDVPKWGTPDNHKQNPISDWLDGLVRDGYLKGISLPSPRQPDCAITYGPDYPIQCSPGLGLYQRQ